MNKSGRGCLRVLKGQVTMADLEAGESVAGLGGKVCAP